MGGSVGDGRVGGGGFRSSRASSVHHLFTAFSTRRDREERASWAAVSHQRQVLKEDRHLLRRWGRFSFLASARDPRSFSPTPRSVT